MSLAYETLGQGPDLVLLHGWGMNAGVWAPWLERLAADWRLTLIELPGHGESAADMVTAELSDWATAALGSAPEQAFWLGWSLGGLVAQQAALMAPERLLGLILVSSTPCFVRREDWPSAMQAETFQAFADNLASDSVRTLDRFLALQVRGAEGERETLRQLRQGLRERPQARPEALHAGLALLLETDLRQAVSGLRVPSLWLFGGRDALVPAAAADAVTTLLPQARTHRISSAGHAPFLSHPKDCLSQLRGFTEAVHADA